MTGTRYSAQDRHDSPAPLRSRVGQITASAAGCASPCVWCGRAVPPGQRLPGLTNLAAEDVWRRNTSDPPWRCRSRFGARSKRLPSWSLSGLRCRSGLYPRTALPGARWAGPHAAPAAHGNGWLGVTWPAGNGRITDDTDPHRSGFLVVLQGGISAASLVVEIVAGSDAGAACGHVALHLDFRLSRWCWRDFPPGTGGAGGSGRNRRTRRGWPWDRRRDPWPRRSPPPGPVMILPLVGGAGFLAAVYQPRLGDHRADHGSPSPCRRSLPVSLRRVLGADRPVTTHARSGPALGAMYSPRARSVPSQAHCSAGLRVHPPWHRARR